MAPHACASPPVLQVRPRVTFKLRHDPTMLCIASGKFISETPTDDGNVPLTLTLVEAL